MHFVSQRQECEGLHTNEQQPTAHKNAALCTGYGVMPTNISTQTRIHQTKYVCAHICVSHSVWVIYMTMQLSTHFQLTFFKKESGECVDAACTIS